MPHHKKANLNDIMALRQEGLKYREIAERLGTTEQCIKNAVYLAGKKKKTRPRFTQKQTEALVEKYSGVFSSGQYAGALKEENAGRAKAANLYILQCATLGQQVDHENINSLYAAFEAFIRLSVESDFPMTVSTACLALGLNKEALAHWKKGSSHANDPEYKTFAESVYYAIQAGIEACMATGLINPVVGIWWEKSHFGMIEQQRQEAAQTDPLGEKKSAEEIMEQYSGVELPD